jgi:hypothetical protein
MGGSQRVDNTDTGFACVREFMRSGAIERIDMLRAPDKQDALDYECPRKPQRVRLVRNVSLKGEQRLLMTNLFDDKLYPASCFGELYHKRSASLTHKGYTHSGRRLGGLSAESLSPRRVWGLGQGPKVSSTPIDLLEKRNTFEQR